MAVRGDEVAKLGAKSLVGRPVTQIHTVCSSTDGEPRFAGVLNQALF
jgi:hypothetical protein